MRKFTVLFLGLATTLFASAQTVIESEGLVLIENPGSYCGYQQPTQTSFTLEFNKTYLFQVDGDYYVTVTGQDMPDPKILGVGSNVFMFYDWDGWCTKYNQNHDSDFALAGYDSFKMESGIYEVWAEEHEYVGDCGDLNLVRRGSIDEFATRGYNDTIGVTINYIARKRVQKSNLNVSSGPWVCTMRTHTYYDYESTEYEYYPSRRLAQTLGYLGCYAFYIPFQSAGDDVCKIHVDQEGIRDLNINWPVATKDWTSIYEPGSGTVSAHSGSLVIIYNQLTGQYLLETVPFNGSMIDYITAVPSVDVPKVSSDRTYSVLGIAGAQDGLVIKDGKVYYMK